ncbi:hypothetical protein C8Q73DRAFT_601742, partial [Cubamyces lactineus]
LPSPPHENALPYASEVLPCSLHFVDGGMDLIVSYVYHGIVCWNVSSRAWKWRIQTGTRVARSSLSPDGSTIAICNLLNGFVRYDLNTGEMIRHYPVEVVENVPLPVIFIHQGRALLCGSDRGEVSIFNTEAGSLVQVLHHQGLCEYEYADGVDWIATGTSETGDRTNVILWYRHRG